MIGAYYTAKFGALLCNMYERSERYYNGLCPQCLLMQNERMTDGQMKTMMLMARIFAGIMDAAGGFYQFVLSPFGARSGTICKRSLLNT